MKSFSLLFAAIPLASAHVHARAADGLVKINSYNYTNLGGPLNWYGLNTSANEACAKGSHQSPIDIVTDAINYTPATALNFSVSTVDSAKFENLGSGLEVVITNGSLVANNKTFPLAQFHFHTPSEHRVNEEYFPMEVHFVFETEAKDIAVIAFLLELSPFGFTTPLLDSVFAHLDDISTPGTYTETNTLDFSGVIDHFNSHGIYSYTGSLTTPPCSENVLWYVSTEPLPINVQQYRAVKSVLKFNARYTQDALGQPNLLQVSAKTAQ
ncbi:putative carbonic anhydrase [Talaromyces proteolyticus]|uniref:Carbonic anhydrase n=1 Tax=Talaromyces proteolyticus TaxID=1131652 RepID=A0AAD4PSK8_9EURO|nr:putative carbonic anhydrase [Talaromyces proteolyticus]KAH8691566.1 putative carbonic anhydrase [Talaromyces proteolyticus]